MESYPKTYTSTLVPPVHHGTDLLLVSNSPLILPSQECGGPARRGTGLTYGCKNPRACGSRAPKTYKISPLHGGDGPAKALFTGAQDLLIHVRILKTYGITYTLAIADRHRKFIGN